MEIKCVFFSSCQLTCRSCCICTWKLKSWQRARWEWRRRRLSVRWNIQLANGNHFPVPGIPCRFRPARTKRFVSRAWAVYAETCTVCRNPSRSCTVCDNFHIKKLLITLRTWNKKLSVQKINRLGYSLKAVINMLSEQIFCCNWNC